VNSAIIAILGLGWLWAAYAVYGRIIDRKLIRPDNANTTPAHHLRDNIDYSPTHPIVLFGHHFSSIAGAGPIIGPVIAVAAFGYGASLLWVLVGVVFIGAVHDYTTAILSVRHGGESVPGLAQNLLGPSARILFLVFVWITLIFVVAVFLIAAAKTFISDPRCVIPALGMIPLATIFGLLTNRAKMHLFPATAIALVALIGLFILGAGVPVVLPFTPEVASQIWIAVLVVYCAAAAVLPVWILLQPRDYIACWVLAFGMVTGFVGLFVTHPKIVAPAFSGTSSSSGPLWPMLFVLVACGAVSGFHSLVSSGTTSKQVDRESHVKPVVFGAMIVEGGLALMATLAVAAGLAFSSDNGPSLTGFMSGANANPIGAFAAGYGTFTAPFLGAFGAMFGVVMINSFVLTTLDTSVRLGRFITGELGGAKVPILKNRYVATLLVSSLSWALAASGNVWTLWPVFGASNQLVAALALIVITAWMMKLKRPVLYTLLPAVFMLVTTVGALVWQGHDFMFGKTPSLPLAISTAVLIALALFVGVRGAVVIFKK